VTVNIAEVTAKAAHLIDTHGHAKGIAKDFDGSMCLNGAIVQALGYELPPLSNSAPPLYMAQVQQVIKAMGFECLAYAAWWNNDEERTVEEVTEKLRETAAKYAEAKVDAQPELVDA
jgi:hypothetical protein